jgi:hypothetical protein
VKSTCEVLALGRVHRAEQYRLAFLRRQQLGHQIDQRAVHADLQLRARVDVHVARVHAHRALQQAVEPLHARWIVGDLALGRRRPRLRLLRYGRCWWCWWRRWRRRAASRLGQHLRRLLRLLGQVLALCLQQLRELILIDEVELDQDRAQLLVRRAGLLVRGESELLHRDQLIVDSQTAEQIWRRLGHGELSIFSRLARA